MKSLSLIASTKKIALVVAACLPALVSAAPQSVIASANEPYLAKPEIKFVIKAAETKPAEIRAAPPTPPLETLSAKDSGQSVAPAAIKPVLLETWNVLARDITLSATLTRWGQPGNYQVLWAATKDLPAMNATYQGGFEVALESLMEDTKHSGYPLHACLYNNKVVRVLHATQSCDQ